MHFILVGITAPQVLEDSQIGPIQPAGRSCPAQLKHIRTTLLTFGLGE
jgi:hypothetical protein